MGQSKLSGAEITFQNAIKVTKPGGSISNIGYHGKGDFVGIPRIDWGVGMAEKTINTALCPGGSLRLGRLLRLLEKKKNRSYEDDDSYFQV